MLKLSTAVHCDDRRPSSTRRRGRSGMCMRTPGTATPHRDAAPSMLSPAPLRLALEGGAAEAGRESLVVLDLWIISDLGHLRDRKIRFKSISVDSQRII